MKVNYKDGQTVQFRVLSEEQLEELYLATLVLLERTGAEVHNQEALELLAAAGARVSGQRVRIPPHLVQEALVSAPKVVNVYGRDPAHHLLIAKGHIYYGPGPTCSNFTDPYTLERRPFGRGDAGLTALVSDALPHIDYVMSLGLISDVRAELAPVYEFAEMMAHTTKPILAWGYSRQNVEDIYRLAVAVAGSEEQFKERPNFLMLAECTSPLMHTEEALDRILFAVERDVPVVFVGGAQAGSTGPITGAGVLALTAAQNLSGLVIAQLKKRGATYIMGGVPTAMDMRTARFTYGSPEMNLFSAALADLAGYLGLNMMGTAGCTDSKVLDLQAGIEAAITILMAGLSGANLIHDVGFLDCADQGSLHMLVMSDEIISLVKRILRGLEINERTLMLDVIDRVGPGGHFLMEEETSRLCRTEVWTPSLMDRNDYTTWQLEGAKTMHDRLVERVRYILENHEPQPLPAAAQEAIDEILKEAERRYAG